MSQESAKPVLRGEAGKVGRHYDQMWQIEAARLETWSGVEYGMTLRYLQRFVPDGATVAEIGVGVGHYSEHLARRGCTLHLVDVSQKLLDSAAARLRERGLSARVASVTRASATDLGFLPSDAMDAVLLLGPLYHLREPAERRQATAEAARILKAGGLLFAAAINRLTYLRDMYRRLDMPGLDPALVENIQGLFRRELRDGKFPAEYLATGRLDPEHAPPLGYAHVTTLTEFRELFARDFEELLLAGMESFTSPALNTFSEKAPEDRELWLDLVEKTNTTPEGQGYSDHWLFVGRQRA
jgi:SAM-dependent methyltransferase